MAKFTFTETPLQGVYVIESTVFGDSRGYFMETYQYEEFKAMGIPQVFVQDNQSKSSQGVLRGIHFQTKNPQGKLVRVVSGEVFDVGVDLRQGSETFGQWFGVLLSAENKKQFYVPEGFGHGFAVLSETAEFAYKCTAYYDPTGEGGIAWDDPDLDIDWHLDKNIKVNLSEKDKNNQSFKEYCKAMGK